MTTVHLLIPYWGPPELLDLAVSSVLGQDDSNWLLTIVDDHYPDDHARRTYHGHPDPRIEYSRNAENLGVAGNFERCRTLVRGDLAVFLGCDDLLHEGYVGRLRGLLTEYPHAQIFQPGVEVVDENGTPSRGLTERIKSLLAPRGLRPRTMSGPKLAESLLRGNWLYWPSLAFRNEVIRGHSFRQDLPIILDLALIIDLVVDGATLVIDDEVCFSYRRHVESASSTSLVSGIRFADERRFFRETASRLNQIGWHRAGRISARHLVSRLHSLTLLPEAIRISASERSFAPLTTIARHTLGR